MREIRVLHILGELRPSGMERMLVSGAAAFHKLKIVGAVLGVGSQHPYAQAIRDAGYDVTTTAFPVHGQEGGRVLRDLVEKIQPDVIHIHTEGKYLQTAVAVKRLVGRGVVVRTVHNVFEATGSWFFSRLAQSLVADRLMDAVLAPSPDVARNEKRFGRKVRVIYNWVDDRFFALSHERAANPRASDGGPVVIVGNCSRIKNHEVALEAAIKGGLTVAHVGSEDGASETEIILLEQLKQRGLLLARGASDPAPSLLCGRVFAMPSLHEGMPVALAEALVVGLPAVVTDAPGLTWAIGQSGVMSLQSSSAEKWLEALRVASVAGSPTIDFHADRGAGEYDDVYRSALRAKERR